MSSSEIAGVVPEPPSALYILSDLQSKKSGSTEQEGNDLTQQVKAVALNLLKILQALFNSHKGIYAIAKLGRNVESLMIEWNKYVQETTDNGTVNNGTGGSTTIPDSNPSFNTGFRESLKTLSIANGILAGVSSLVSINERIEHVKRVVQVIKEIAKGDWASVTLNLVLDELAFWLKQAANDIEFIRFLESHRFYNLGAASNGLTIAKSFFDGFGSVFGIWLSVNKLRSAIQGVMDNKASEAKWEERSKNIRSWDLESLKKHAEKMDLKTHLFFLEEVIKMAKGEKADEKAVANLESQKESVRQALFLRKIDKILHTEWINNVDRQLKLARLTVAERSFVYELLRDPNYSMKERFSRARFAAIESALRLAGRGPEGIFRSESHIQAVLSVLKNPFVYQFFNKENMISDRHLTPLQREALIADFSEIRDRAWTSKLSPASRKVILDILDDKSLSLVDKREALLRIYNRKVNDKYFGVYAEDLNAETEGLFKKKKSEHKYHDLYHDAELAVQQWGRLHENPALILAEGKAGNEARSHLEIYAKRKFENFKEIKGDQKKIITRSSVSIGFSCGIIALVSLSLTLAFAKPGTLPGFIVKWRPFIFAGLGITVSTIGLVKFGVDELFKIKPRPKPLLDKRFMPLPGPSRDEFLRGVRAKLASLPAGPSQIPVQV